MVFGTVGYMSPEQVRGATADRRTDIFALGAILYEMLTGRRAFSGESMIETMTAILRDEPLELALSERSLPPGLMRLVAHCLQKRPEQRFQSAQDVAFALEALSGESSPRAALETGSPSPGSRVAALKWRAAAAVVGLVAIAAVPVAIVHLRERLPEVSTTRFSVTLPPGTRLGEAGGALPLLELSPDGRYVAFRAVSAGGVRSIWVRPVDDLAARPLEGTENPQTFFWSPDSRLIAFAADGVLRSVPVSGGAAQTIAKLPPLLGTAAPLGGSWSENGTILLGGNATVGAPIWRVDAQGGEFSQVTKRNYLGFDAYPVFLPDGRRFLFSRLGEEETGLYLGSLDSSQPRFLSPDYIQPKLAAGFLFFARERTLMAQVFDVEQGQLASEPSVVADDVSSDAFFGRASYSVSDSALVFTSGDVGLTQFTWFRRSGQPEQTIGEPGVHFTMALAGDGGRLVYGRREDNGTSLWIADLIRGVTMRVTFGGARDSDGTWSPDGSRLAFASVRQGEKSLYEIPATGGIERLVLKAEGRAQSVDDWSPDGRFILYHTDSTGELWALPVSGDGKAILVIRPPSGRVDEPVFSPDGKWIAYNSEESGRLEVYVTPFPPTGARWQVS